MKKAFKGKHLVPPYNEPLGVVKGSHQEVFSDRSDRKNTDQRPLSVRLPSGLARGGGNRT